MFIWRFLRRVLAQLIRLLLLNRAVTLGLLTVLIVGFVIMPLMASSGRLPGSISQAAMLGNGQPAQAATASDGDAIQAASSSQSLPPDPAVQTYIKGMLAFDANTMWTALHPQLKSQLQGQGMTLDGMKAQEAQKAKSGVRYDKVYYIGSFEGRSGLRYYFYAVTLTGTDSTGQLVDSELAYTFAVAPDGGGIVDIGAK